MPKKAKNQKVFTFENDICVSTTKTKNKQKQKTLYKVNTKAKSDINSVRL